MTSSRKAKPATELRPFERVWKLVLRIPRGRVATYGQLSELIERRLTPIGVGWAIRAVPEGAIPWHRVVNASGGISTNAEHPGLQRKLLEAEGVRFDAQGCVDLERFGWRPRVTVTAPSVKKRAASRRPAPKKRASSSRGR
jgi:methylated-DNA-protein-cysteine methyltransferase-like protein